MSDELVNAMDVPDAIAAPQPLQSEGVRRKELTKAEEDRLYTLFVTTEKAQRFLLLEAYEGKAHKAVKKASFEEYCQTRLGLSYDKARLSRVVSAARVERALTGEGYSTTQKALPAPEGEFKPKLSERTAVEIARLPESEWPAMYAEHTALLADKKNKNLTSKELHHELRKIVDRRWKELNPTATPKARKAGSSSAGKKDPAAGMAPGVKVGADGFVHGETYDGADVDDNTAAPGAAEYVHTGTPQDDWKKDAVPEATAPDTDEAPALLTAEIAEELMFLRKFVADFVSAMEMPAEAQPEVRIHELYNEATAYQQAHGR